MPKSIIAGFFLCIPDKDNYQYYQNTTNGFEFTDANFTIKAQSKIAKGDKLKNQLQLSILCALHLFIWVYISMQ